MQILGLDCGREVGKGEDPGSGCGDGLSRKGDVGGCNVGETRDGHCDRSECAEVGCVLIVFGDIAAIAGVKGI